MRVKGGEEGKEREERGEREERRRERAKRGEKEDKGGQGGTRGNKGEKKGDGKRGGRKRGSGGGRKEKQDCITGVKKGIRQERRKDTGRRRKTAIGDGGEPSVPLIGSGIESSVLPPASRAAEIFLSAADLFVCPGYQFFACSDEVRARPSLISTRPPKAHAKCFALSRRRRR